MSILYLLEDTGSYGRDLRVKCRYCQNQLYLSHVLCFVRYSETYKDLPSTVWFTEQTSLQVMLCNCIQDVLGSNLGRD
jgi:hypothetical protein